MIGKVKILNVLDEAIKIATEAHVLHVRKYVGPTVPYITHPKRVAERVSKLETATPDMIAAAWLHDVIEDCDPRWRDKIAQRCGVEVFVLVHELTNPSKGLKAPRERRKAIDCAHLVYVSPEAKLIKLIDRTDNLMEMSGADEDFKRLYIKESEDLFLVLHNTSRGIPSLAADSDALCGEYMAALKALQKPL